MRKNSFYIVLVFLFTVFSCSERGEKDKFVSIVNEQFQLNGKPFYPVTLNYMVSVQTDGKILWPSSLAAYNPGARHRYTSRDSCLLQLKADFDLIKEMGFNTVRIVEIGEEAIDKKTGELKIKAALGNNNSVLFSLNKEENYTKYYTALNDLFDIINKAGLKTIFLTRMSVDIKSTENHLSKLVSYFKDDTSILAYDLFNEPLYFDTVERDKKVVYETVKRWAEIIKKNAPNHLSTIGLEGIREVFEWDPNILELDFLTLHPYEYEPEQVRNEIYWYGKYIKKPWMLGETSLPADNDSVSYETQRQFARKTLQQTLNCGGIGYAWWQYKDVEWYKFHANFMGVVSLKGMTKTKKNDLIYGTVKPVAKEFSEFDPLGKKDTCRCLSNYYNYSDHRSCRIVGILKDGKGNPVEGGVLLGYNLDWTNSYHTISRQDGSFELLGNFPFYHFMASATEHTRLRGEILPDTSKVIDGIRTINLGEVKVEKLDFVD